MLALAAQIRRPARTSTCRHPRRPREATSRERGRAAPATPRPTTSSRHRVVPGRRDRRRSSRSRSPVVCCSRPIRIRSRRDRRRRIPHRPHRRRDLYRCRCGRDRCRCVVVVPQGAQLGARRVGLARRCGRRLGRSVLGGRHAQASHHRFVGRCKNPNFCAGNPDNNCDERRSTAPTQIDGSKSLDCTVPGHACETGVCDPTSKACVTCTTTSACARQHAGVQERRVHCVCASIECPSRRVPAERCVRRHRPMSRGSADRQGDCPTKATACSTIASAPR